MIEDIIDEFDLSPTEVEGIKILMHEHEDYHKIFGNLIGKNYAEAYETLFKKCVYVYLTREDFS